MRYITINELSDIIRHNLWKVPHDIDLVVGVPRSGMLPASMIALYLNANLGDVESLINGKYFAVGQTRKYMMRHNDIKKVLVVDDSVGSGASMTETRKILSPISSKYEFTYLAPITTTIGKDYVDIFFEIVDESRIFEWNLFHHGRLENACFDLDGVLCQDPIIDDDGEQYINFLKTATPLFIPTAHINTIITCRLEKYRKQTEEWLAKYNIKYQKLVMLDMPTKAARIRWGKHGEFKGEYYKRCDCYLFIESSLSQAKIIAEISGKAVICIETNSMIINPKTITQKIKNKLSVWLPDCVVEKYREIKKKYYSN